MTYLEQYMILFINHLQFADGSNEQESALEKLDELWYKLSNLEREYANVLTKHYSEKFNGKSSSL